MGPGASHGDKETVITLSFADQCQDKAQRCCTKQLLRFEGSFFVGDSMAVESHLGAFHGDHGNTDVGERYKL